MNYGWRDESWREYARCVQTLRYTMLAVAVAVLSVLTAAKALSLRVQRKLAVRGASPSGSLRLGQ
jgi:hypothetical protein